MKQAEFLLINDIHVSRDSLQDFQKNWDEALDICKKRGIVDIIIGGDLWQSRSSQTLDVLLAVRDAIIKAGNADITLTIAEGNHDLIDQESLYGYSHIFSEYKNVFVVDDYMPIDFGENGTLYVMSYFPEDGSFTERLEDMVQNDFNPSNNNILYIHEGINGALATPSKKELPTKIFKDFDKVLVGHYHNRTKIKNTNIEYIGSSRQANFGEDEMKGYTILFDDGTTEFIQNQVNTRYKVIDVPANGIDDDLLAELNQIKEEGKYKVKLRVSCDSTVKSTIDKKKLIAAGATKVEIDTIETDTKKVSSHALDKKYDKHEIVNEWKEFCISKGNTNVELGLKYLEKIS